MWPLNALKPSVVFCKYPISGLLYKDIRNAIKRRAKAWCFRVTSILPQYDPLVVVKATLVKFVFEHYRIVEHNTSIVVLMNWINILNENIDVFIISFVALHCIILKCIEGQVFLERKDLYQGSGLLVWVTRNRSVVSSSSSKGFRCFLEQETSHCLVLTGWFQSRIRSWFT